MQVHLLVCVVIYLLKFIQTCQRRDCHGATLFATTKKELLSETGKEALAKTEEGITGSIPVAHSYSLLVAEEFERERRAVEKWIS